MKEAVDQIRHWADRFDVMVIGPGLGRDELVHTAVKEVSNIQIYRYIDITIYSYRLPCLKAARSFIFL